MVKKFYSLKAALATFQHPEFLIAHECKIEYDGGVREREYFLFKTIDEYLQNRKNFPHSHEVVFRLEREPPVGRWAFDFDFKESIINDNFQTEVEEVINKTIEIFFTDVSSSLLEFVWLVSPNEKKYSKHLIVKNCVWENDWVKQSIIAYDLFELVAKKFNYFTYITEPLIDKKVARENATLRMPLNAKIKGSELSFVDKKYSFTDGLIKLYRKNDVMNEQSLTKNNYKINIIEELAPQVFEKHFSEKKIEKKIVFLKHNSVMEIFINTILRSFLKDIFEISKIEANRIDLLRKRSDNCLIDKNKYHENENAFIFFDEKAKICRFFCRRGCTSNGKNNIKIGKIQWW